MKRVLLGEKELKVITKFICKKERKKEKNVSLVQGYCIHLNFSVIIFVFDNNNPHFYQPIGKSG